LVTEPSERRCTVNFSIGQYYPGTSVIHLMDPRVKMVLMLVYIILIFFIGSFAGYAAAGLFTMAMILWTKIPLRFFIKVLKPLMFLIIITFVMNLFAYGDHFRPTLHGLGMAFRMALRLVYLVVGCQMLTLTTSTMDVTSAMEDLLSPLKKLRFPVHELSMMMTIALRFIPTLMEETDKIIRAQKSRGADFESGNLLQRAKAMVPLLVPLFVSSFRRADELAMAMEARCYRGGEGRTRMKQLRSTRLDLWACLVFAAYGILIILDKIFLGA